MTTCPHPEGIASRLAGFTCTACSARFDEAYGPCPACGGPLWCRYDLGGLEADHLREAGRGLGVFRWSALLPVRDPARRLSLGEGGTPLVPLPRQAEELGLATLLLKDEGGNPTGSFKARGLAVSVAAHAERGARAITLPTAGNAGGAAATYARRHGLGCRVAMPTAATPTFRAEQRLAGARVVAVSGDLGEAGRWVREHPGPADDHVVATFHEPFRVEGKKTMAFELWEALGESLPDVIVYPTGGGTGLVAMEKGFSELREAGLLAGPSPRLVAAQVDACSPVVRAFHAGTEAVEPWEQSRRTLAEGLRVPRLGGGKLVLSALRATGGTAHSVSEAALLEALRQCAAADGVLPCAEGAVALAALRALRREGQLAGTRVVVFNTATIYKSPETLAAAAAG